VVLLRNVPLDDVVYIYIIKH